jgi:hypothetical protein
VATTSSPKRLGGHVSSCLRPSVRERWLVVHGQVRRWGWLQYVHHQFCADILTLVTVAKTLDGMSMPDTMDPLSASLFRRLTARYTGVTLLPLPTTGSSILIKRKPQKTQNLKRQHADQATLANECTSTMNSLPHLGSRATYFTCTANRHQSRSPTHINATRKPLIGVHLATILSLTRTSFRPLVSSYRLLAAF